MANGNSTIGRRITAVLLTMVLAILMTACDKKQKEPEKKEPRKPSGYRVYRTDMDNNGDVAVSRLLVEEFEDLVTEKSWIRYERVDEEKSPSFIQKWYYDDDGEVLLKEVSWGNSSYDMAKSAEYDHMGRLIRYSVRQDYEAAEDEYISTPGLPEEYGLVLGTPGNDSWLYSKIRFLDMEKNVREIQTEYTYEGDSGRIISLESVSENGAVIAYAERGEGDIILSATMDFGTCRYVEKYDEKERKSEWMLYDNSLTMGPDTDLFLHYDGEKEFDGKGRLVRYVRYEHEYDSVQHIDEEIIFTYDTAGRSATVKYYDDSGTVYMECICQYDSEDRTLKEEKYDLENGQLLETRTLTYHSNGLLAVDNREAWNEVEGKLVPSSYYEYDEDGTKVQQRDYYDDMICYDYKRELLEEPGIAGTVMRTRSTYYKDGEMYWRDEDSSVKVIAGGEEWLTYSSRYGSPEDPSESYTSKFDDKGRIIESKRFLNLYQYEYDEQGRIIRESISYNRDNYSDCVFEYEYWENEKPETAEN